VERKVFVVGKERKHYALDDTKRRLRMSVAICDPEAFYPLRSLVAGPLTKLSKLAEVERFVRAVVLNDEISMEMEPWPYEPEADEGFTEEELRAGARSVIVAIGPDLTGYDFFKNEVGVGKPQTPDLTLSPALVEAARKYSNAEEGNVYYEAHIEFLQRIVSQVRKGGSAVLEGEFGRMAIDASSRYPEKLFENLDLDWQKLARDADAGELGFMVPPVLSIILTRCETREAIPTILKDLRDEWANARAKVWVLLDQLKTVATVGETREIQQELAAASRLLSPTQNETGTPPVRVLWDLVGGTLTGTATALLSGGPLTVGAIVGAVGGALRSLPTLIGESGPVLFGHGAFDLARRVRREAVRVEHSALARLLTDAEKRNLGL
jgi:hypothetical protein